MAFISSTSRFKKTSLIKTRTGKDTYGLIEGMDQLKNLNGDQFAEYTTPNNISGRPDLIAQSFYGDPQLEWVIVIANRPKNPLNWPAAGEVIKLPNRDFVRSLI